MISDQAEEKIRKLLEEKIRQKVLNFEKEYPHRPFDDRIIGQHHLKTYSFIHSLKTGIGMSVWEELAVILAEDAGFEAKKQYDLLGDIDKDTRTYITTLHDALIEGQLTANKKEETENIRHRIKKGEEKRHKGYSRVDIYIKKHDQENYIDIITVGPNKKDYQTLKEKLLKWTALKLSQDVNAMVFTRLAIPYNPYHPKSYGRWTLEGLYDLHAGEILIGEDFWNFVAADEVYGDILNIFEEFGEPLKAEIDQKIIELKNP